MKNPKITNILLALVLMLALSSYAFTGAALAGNSIYVNDSQSVLGTNIYSAWAVGSGGSSVIGGKNVITGSGIVSLGEGSVDIPNVPSGEPDGTTVSVSVSTVKVGLYFSDNALSTANLENEVGAGYQFGYFDSGRAFHSLGSTNETRITMKPTGSGTEVTVYITGTETVLYTHSDAGKNLAVRPVSDSGKAVTWFKNNTYYGDFEYFRCNGESKLTVIGVLPLEDYVKGVVPYEMPASWSLDALKAQAVCARTYLAANVNSWSKYGFDVTNDQRSQAYGGLKNATANSNAAVEQTEGEYLTYKGRLCSALYSSSSGGGTEDNENVNGNNYHPYLKGVIDPFEESVSSINYYSSWTKTLTPEQLGSRVGLGEIVKAEPTYSDTNNCIKLVLTDVDGKTATVQRDACRTRLGMNSIHYTVTRDSSGNFVFTGGGLGHNVGMSQYGAYAMAKNYGLNYRQILRFYFTGVNISAGV